MSDFLLQKSFKLLQDSKGIKKTKQSEKLRLKKKKHCLISRQLKQEEFVSNINKNLQRLEKLNQEASVDVSEKALARCTKNCDKDIKTEEREEETVFTEKDFEEFEKEYFGD